MRPSAFHKKMLQATTMSISRSYARVRLTLRPWRSSSLWMAMEDTHLRGGADAFKNFNTPKITGLRRRRPQADFRLVDQTIETVRTWTRRPPWPC